MVPLYGPDAYAMYRKGASDEAAAAAEGEPGEVSERSVGSRRGSVGIREVSSAPPHLFELAESAYTELVQTQRDQARASRDGGLIGALLLAMPMLALPMLALASGLPPSQHPLVSFPTVNPHHPRSLPLRAPRPSIVAARQPSAHQLVHSIANHSSRVHPPA